jgi:hypothetical protein
MKLKDLKEEISEFIYNKVWVTRKCRMEAEARMNSNHIFSQFLVNYYTFVVLSFSIWTLVLKDDAESKTVALLTVISSVGLFGVSLFISSIGFREKAMLYKDSYINLGRLETELKNLLRSSDDHSIIKTEFYSFEKSYNDILAKTDNHSNIENLTIKKQTDSKLSFENNLKYYSHKTSVLFIKVAFCLMPILLAIYYFYKLKETSL